MKHIEDLNVDDFLKIISNIKEVKATIKLDGTVALGFGIDEEGRFYTGYGRDFKKIKPEYRKYTEKQWIDSNSIFINPAVSAHKYLESNIEIIKRHVKPGEYYLAELLYTDRPNCIKYKFNGHNKIIILNNINLSNELTKGIVETVNLVFDGMEIVNKDVTHIWEPSHIETIDLFEYGLNEMEDCIINLKFLLDDCTYGMLNIDLLKMRAIGSNKESILRARDKFMSHKLYIKNKMLDAMSKIKGKEHIPADGYKHEGIVLEYEGLKTKVVDKEYFTKIHDRDWKPVYDAKKLQNDMDPDDAIDAITYMIENFSNMYGEVDYDMRDRMKDQLRMIILFIQQKCTITQ